jgi:cyclophilin family peptidyl-prolyl cis-trans isomerase
MNQHRFQHFVAGLAIVAASLCLVACSDDTSEDSNRQGDAVGELAPPAPVDTSDAQVRDTGAPVITHKVEIETDLGSFTVGLYGRDAPKTVENFVGLAKRGFYNGTRFHRVVHGFVIQGGDPLSKDTAERSRWGTGGESIYGGEFDDELDPTSPSGRIGYVRGTLAMANRGPNTQTSQFFVILTDEGGAGLPYDYTIFGTVLSGFDTVDRIELTGRVLQDYPGGVDTVWTTPREPAVIQDVTVQPVSQAS